MIKCLNHYLEDFEKALKRLEEVLENWKKTEIVRDSAIQRFEICCRFSLEDIKSLFRRISKSRFVRSPKGCFREALAYQGYY
jgi:hypothetical protein